MMLKRLIFLLLFTAAGAYAQNFRYENLLINQNGAPVVEANVGVCAGQVTPNFSNNPPCTLATIYSDLPGKQQISQSIVSSVGTSTQTGSFAFVVATGTYPLAINGADLQASDLITVPNVARTTIATNLDGPGTISGTFGGNHTTTGNNTHSETETFTGPQTVGKWNGNCIVDSTANATLADAITCAGSSGVIEIPLFAVPTFNTATIPVGVTLRFDGPSCLNNSGTLTINGPIVAPPVQIFCGTGTVALNQGVGPVHAVWWPGADMGAKLNAAYASLPASGGQILLDSNPGVGCWSYTTPILFTTVGKYIILQGTDSNANSTANPSFYGSCLRYTPTTATSAIQIDWTESIGGGYAAGSGIRDITLTNGVTDCSTSGGCGSSSIGIEIGKTNSGAHKALFENVRILGFGVGIQFSTGDAGGLGWGITWLNSSVDWNTTGINYLVPHENDSFTFGAINSNGVGVKLNGGFGGEFRSHGVSYDANATCAIQMNDGAVLALTSSHFENTLGGPPCYVDGGATASSKLTVDSTTIAYDLVNSGTNSSNWFRAGLVDVHFTAISNGRTTSTSLVAGNTRGFAEIVEVTPTLFTGGAIAGGNPAGIVISNPNTYLQMPLYLILEGSAPSRLGGAAPGFDSCYGDSTAHALKCSYNNGTFLRVAQVITTSFTTTAATTDNVTVTGMTASGHCALTPTNSAAAGGIASVFISAKNTDQITVTHAATSGWTFDVLCFPQ
jgi:hypothetical protein